MFDNKFKKFLKKQLIYSKTDLSGNIIDVSDEFCKISGYTKDELIGQSQNIIKNNSSNPMLFIQIWNYLENDKHWEGVIENKNKNGKSYFVYSYIYPLFENGKKVAYEAFSKNILENMLYNSVFDETSKTFEENLNTEIQTITILTNGFELKSINNEAFHFFGFQNFNDFKKQFKDFSKLFILPENIKDTSFLEEDFLLDNDSSGINWIDNVDKKKYCCFNINGKNHLFSVNKNYNFGSIHQISFQNITSHFDRNIKMNEELTQSNNLLKKQEKMVVMGDMLHNIAHQWRQPLGVIASLVSSIKFDLDNDMLEDEELLENIVLIEEQSHYLTNTIDTFRNYLKNNEDIVEIDLIKTISTTISLISHVYNVNNITINFDYDKSKEKYVTYGIEDQLIQVIINLFNNSKDAFLEKEDLGDRKVDIFIKIEDNKNIIIFEDNAGGIPAYIIDSVFEPYVSTKGKNGTGIGLNMSFDIITKSFLGNISVKNNNNPGASFCIVLPI